MAACTQILITGPPDANGEYTFTECTGNMIDVVEADQHTMSISGNIRTQYCDNCGHVSMDTRV